MDPREQDMIRKMQEETKDIEVPKSLEPEQIEQKLAAYQEEKKYNKAKWFAWKPAYTGALVAGAFLLCLTLAAAKDLGVRKCGDMAAATAQGKSEQTVEEKENEESAEAVLATPKDYEEVFVCLEEYQKQMEESYTYGSYAENAVEDIAPFAETESAAALGKGVDSGVDTGSYSETNVRQQGVDEGDTVKTDGSYLYALKDGANEISIVDIRQDTMKQVSRVELEKGAQISEFYVAEGRLMVCYTTYPDIEEDKGYQQNVTHAVTYDISDPEHPAKAGEVTQAGYYYSSRITDGYLYLFSQFYVDSGIAKEETEQYIPSVQGKLLPLESIYLPESHRGCQYMVVSSMKLEKPDEICDSKGIFYEGGQIYVSQKNIYLTAVQYHQEEETETAIQKITYQAGKLTGKAQTTVKGYLDDSFALDEYEGYLRMVVTRDNTESLLRLLPEDGSGSDGEENVQSNSVYVLNEELETVGKIENLAENERVYSSRFMGDTAYFVTFEQTDPLFSVDLSDPKHPKVIGKLKLPGFSDYLHPYGDGLLLGIGIDMDEEGITSNGVKISMYDISDPSDVKEIQKYVLEDTYGSPALYDYKAVLTDLEKGLVGFPVYADQELYYVFSYDEQRGFTVEMEEEVNNTSYLTTRGVFAGERLYVIGSNVIESYRISDYQKVDDLIL